MSDESNQVAFEHSLRGVSPAAVRVDPIAAAFAAGRGSVRRRLRLWQSTTAVTMLLLGMASWSIHIQSNLPVAPPTVLAIAPKTSTPAAALSEQSLIMLQQSVRDKGIDGLPAAYVPAGRSVRTSDSL